MSPQKLGRYQVIEELGKGAMGLVYLGEDPIIGRQLALKTFRVGLSAKDAELEQFRARFLREAQSAGRLAHPNIVTIHDVVEEGGEFVIAMEYIKGTDLKHLMQRQERLDLRFVVDIVAQISDGLDYAHSRGVVHRDIKPANIIITAEKIAKITDFGIARVDQSNLTVEGQLLGTPNYMAPEQIQGKEVDHRADLFSLGVMLYELVTGKKPFAGENLTVVTHRIVYENFVSPDRLVPGLPPRLLEVLDKSLQKDPDKRYARGADMSRDLRAVFSSDSSPRLDTSIASFLSDVDSALSNPAFGGSGTGSGPGPAFGGGSPGPGFGGGTMTASPSAFAGAGTMTGGTSSPSGFGGGGTLGPGAGFGGTMGPAAAGTGSHPQPGTGVYPPGAFPARGGHYPPPPAAMPPPAAKKNTLVIAIGSLVALALVATLAWLFLRRPPPPPATTPTIAQAEQQSEAGKLIAEGRDLVAQGESGKAFEVLERALVLEPGNQDARRLLEQAQRQMLDSGAQRDDAQVRDQLTRAEAALTTRDYDKAYAIANQILTVDPQNERALRARSDAEEGRRRRDTEQSRVQDRLLKPGVDAGTGGAGGSPVPTPSAPEKVADANLKIELYSELPEGVVNVWVGSKKVWGESFDFGKGGGIFRRGKGSGTLSGGGSVPGGQVKIRAYVVGKIAGESKTLSKELNTTFEGSSNHVLRLQVSAEGTLTVTLD
jgi:serine/threonine protein kinase